MQLFLKGSYMIKVRPYEKGDTFKVQLKDVFYADYETKQKSEETALKGEGITFTLLDDTKVIGVVGISCLWPGVGEAWTLLSEDVRKYPILFHKLIFNGLRFYMKELKLHRLQASVVSDFCTGGKWLSKLGFTKEGTMRKLGVNGDDYDLWARVV